LHPGGVPPCRQCSRRGSRTAHDENPYDLAGPAVRSRTADVATGASDMGPGSYTSMTQVAADALGLPMQRVRFTLGD